MPEVAALRSQRKLSSFLAVAAIASVVLSGCGGDGPVSPSATVPFIPSPPTLGGPYTVTGVVSEVVGGVAVPLGDVHVEDSSRHVVVKTGADGSYMLNDVQSYLDTVYLYFAKPGYAAITRSFTPRSAETRLDVQLVRQ